MTEKKVKTRQGFTLTEMILAGVISTLIFAGIGFLLVDSQTGWNRMYSRAYSEVVVDSYIARRTFDSVVRKADGENFLLDTSGNWLEVYYYENADSVALDRYSRFYKYNDELRIEYGQLDPKSIINVSTVCANVSACVFKQSGCSIQMILTLDNGVQTNTVVTSGFMHN
jgi:hypothetical protein